VGLVNAKNQELAVEFLRMVCTLEGMTEYAKIYGGAAHTAWKGLTGVYDHFEDPSPDSPAVKNAIILQKYLAPQTTFEGEQFGSMDEVGAAIGEACSEVRQKNMTAVEAAQMMQERAEAQYQEYLSDLAELGLEP
jgi:hypothetical protein